MLRGSTMRHQMVQQTVYVYNSTDGADSWHAIGDESTAQGLIIDPLASRTLYGFSGGLVLQSTFTSVPDLGAELFPWLPVRWLGTIRYDTRSKLSRIRVPILIVQGTDDQYDVIVELDPILLKARKKLKWKAHTKLETLVREMVASDLTQQGKVLASNGKKHRE